MAVARTGSILQYTSPATTGNTGTIDSAITVPADAELVIATFHGYKSSAGHFSGGSMLFTKGGTQTAMTAIPNNSQGDTDTGLYQGTMFYLVSPDTGSSKSLTFDWAGTGTLDDAARCATITFFTGVDTASPIRDGGAVQGGASPPGAPGSTGTLTALTDDYIHAVAWGYADGSTGAATTWSNLTEVLDPGISSGNLGTAVASGAPTGNTTVGLTAVSGGWAYGGLIAAVIKPAAGGAISIAADAGSYAVTGTAANLERGRETAAEGGTYAVTGTAASLERGYEVAAAAGSYAVTGSDATFDRTYILPAEAGSYAVTGTDAGLERGYEVAADAGSYAVTGADATFDRTYILPANAGSYAITGSDASLEQGYEVVAEAGSYTVTGQDATFVRAYVIGAGAGSYAVTGTDASLERGYEIAAEAGSYAFSGADAALVLQGQTILAAEAGSYSVTGSDAALEVGREVAAEAGSYTVTGSDAALEIGREVAAEAGSYAFTGADASLIVTGNKSLAAGEGSFSFTGSDAGLIYAPLVPEQIGGGRARKPRDKFKYETPEDFLGIRRKPKKKPEPPAAVEIAAWPKPVVSQVSTPKQVAVVVNEQFEAMERRRRDEETAIALLLLD